MVDDVMDSTTVSKRFIRNPWVHRREKLIETIMFLAAFSAVAITLAIVFILFYESLVFFKEVSIVEFLTSTHWSPLFENPQYGVLPLVTGTLVTSVVALLVAIPIGSIIAIYLSEFAPHKVREVVKPFLELLASVPTVVFGYFALRGSPHGQKSGTASRPSRRNLHASAWARRALHPPTGRKHRG